MKNNSTEILSEFDFVQTPIFVIDENFNVVFWNKTLEIYSSITKNNIVSKNLFEVFPHLNNQAFITRIKDLFLGSPAVVFSALLHKYLIPCKLPNGEYRIQHTTAVIYKPKEDLYSYALFTIKDVTDEANQINNFRLMRNTALAEVEQRKITEEKLLESEKQLKLINANKDRFFSIISHDLKSPFIGLIGFSEMIATDFDSFSSDELKSMMNDINQISRHTFALLQNLLDWSRIQTGRMEITIEAIDLSAIIADVVSLLELNARQKDIVLNSEIDENIKVLADGDMLKTVIRNLVSNALKFTNSGGRVLITANQKSGKTIIYVDDNGVGMPQKVLDKLFKIDEKQTEKGTNAEEGTGLGLILCQDMMKKHNSEIKIESQVGVGSRFYFELESSL